MWLLKRAGMLKKALTLQSYPEARIKIQLTWLFLEPATLVLPY